MNINSLIKQINNNNPIHKHVPRVKQIFLRHQKRFFCFVWKQTFLCIVEVGRGDRRRMDWAMEEDIPEPSSVSRLRYKTKQKKGKITVQQNETKNSENTSFQMKNTKEKRFSSLNSYFLYLWKNTNLTED